MALAKALGVEYHEIVGGDIEAGIRGALSQPGPVLTRVAIDYDKRPLRWLEAARGRFTHELSNEQRARFLARLGARSLDLHPKND
jgi:hypothetical protein